MKIISVVDITGNAQEYVASVGSVGILIGFGYYVQDRLPAVTILRQVQEFLLGHSMRIGR